MREWKADNPDLDHLVDGVLAVAEDVHGAECGALSRLYIKEMCAHDTRLSPDALRKAARILATSLPKDIEDDIRYSKRLKPSHMRKVFERAVA